MTAVIPLIVVPDPDEPDAAEVYVEGFLNGQPYRFLLDTGAAHSSVACDDLTRTWPVHGEHPSSGVFAALRDDLVIAESLALGSIHRRDFVLTRAAESPGRATLIGMDLLKDYCCHFRFDLGQLVIDGPLEAGVSAWQPLTLDRKAHPYVQVRAGTASAWAVWDSGASLTVADRSFIGQHPALFTEVGSSAGTDAGGATVQTPMYVMSAVEIGGREFPPHRVAAVDLSHVNATLDIPMDLILGYNLYSKAAWLFDFPQRRWAFSHPPGG